MSQQGFEINFDGLPGPTHHFGGLAFGNIASMSSKERPSSPKKAALQGLEKMKLLYNLGARQAVLPPHPRPYIPLLRRLGFRGADREIPAKVWQASPELLQACSSSSSMWTANWATITPSIDTMDKRVHITPANLTSHFHRSIEAEVTSAILKSIFADPLYFTVHDPLPASEIFADEGAANQSYFCRTEGEPGALLFCWGKKILGEKRQLTEKFPIRQSLEACEAIERRHQILPGRTFYFEQLSESIDVGAFHSDVVAMAHRNLMLYHEKAFEMPPKVIEKIRQQLTIQCETPITFVPIPQKQIPLKLAISTYLFNSQIISLPEEEMALIAPVECKLQPLVAGLLDEITANPEIPIREVHFVDLKESMLNGGGPACLRLRVLLTQQEIEMIRPKVFFDETLYKKLTAWVQKHYREQLIVHDLSDPTLIDETYAALDELTKILELGSIYPFQRL